MPISFWTILSRQIGPGIGVLLLATGCASDLVIRDIRLVHIKETQQEAIQYTVYNQGVESAPSCGARLRLAMPYAPASVDPLIEEETLPEIKAGESHTVLTVLKLADADLRLARCLGTLVCADSSNTVKEQNPPVNAEGNNCRFQILQHRSGCRTCDLCCGKIPPTFDWRKWKDSNWASPVRDQGECQSCWAFATIASVEAKLNVEMSTGHSMPNYNLSEEQVISCSGAGTCQGGYPAGAFTYMKQNRIVEERCLPYHSHRCTWNSPCFQASIGAFVPIRATSSGNLVDAVKRAILCHGPVTACSQAWRHCVLFVGWNRSAWIFKNSWGTGYGDDGYGTVPFANHRFSDFAQEAYYVEDTFRIRE